MNAGRPPFGYGDLPPVSAELSEDELMAALAVGRELEAIAATTGGEPPAEFVDSVMAAIAREPAPAPVALAEEALRVGRLSLVIAAVRDAWLVALSGPRPVAMRAQAGAFALVVLLVVGSTLGIAAGALGLNPFRTAPSVASPSPAPLTSPVAPSPSPSTPPPPSPSPSASVTPTGSAEPTETPEGSDDHGGSGSGSGRTPRPTATDDHSGPGGTDDHSGPGGGGSGSTGSGSGSSGSGESGGGGGSGSGSDNSGKG